MSMYRTCQYCGANLDAGEVCDCQEKVASSGANTESDKEKISTDNVTDFGGNVNE